MAVGFSTTVGGYVYGFDFQSHLINTDATLDDMSVEDLYTAIKEAQASTPGVVEDVIAYSEGLSTIGTGVQTFITTELQGDWEVNTLKTSGKFQVQGGNLIKANGLDPFLDNPLITYINFLSQAGVKTTVAVGSGLDAGQDAKLDAIFSSTNKIVSTETGTIDVDIKRVNGINVSGVGSAGDPWGPDA